METNSKTSDCNFEEKKAYLQELKKCREPTATPSTEEQLESVNTTLSLNNQLEKKYAILENELRVRLEECLDKLDTIRQSRRSDSSQQVFHFGYCGAPYFRDSNGDSLLKKEDTMKVKQLRIYKLANINFLSDNWSDSDKEDFYNEILKLIQNKRKDKLKESLNRLRSLKKSQQMHTKRIQKNITALRKEIHYIKCATDFPLEQDYDWQELAKRLNFKHTPAELRASWKNILTKVKIENNKWDNTEKEQLRAIATSNQRHDWDKIAKELGTGRTGFECFLYSRTNIMLRRIE